MGLKIITVGDKNSSGGVVISGSPKDTILGKAIARLGDSVDCPAKYPGGRPHGINPIVEGDATYLIEGIPIALDGYKSACGCTLIGSHNSTQDPGSVVRMTNQSPLTWEETPKQTYKSKFSQFFQLKNSDTQEPLKNTPYKITLENGNELEGVTDQEGNTESVFSVDEQSLTIEVN